MEIQSNFTTSGQSGNTTDSQSNNDTESYTTAYVSSTTYKIDLVSAGQGQNETSTWWILKNGTTIATEVDGENLTGIQSQLNGNSLFDDFSAEIGNGSQVSAAAAEFGIHSAGTSTATFGSNAFTVTSYAANTLPELIATGCYPAGGSWTDTLTAFKMSMGEPKGTGYDLLTYVEVAATYPLLGVNLTSSTSTQLISFTIADSVPNA